MRDLSRKEAYIEEWTRLLSAFLGWTPEQVRPWASARYGALMDDDLFYHEMPVYWAVPALIPSTLRDRLSPADLLTLERDILAAFSDERHFYFPPETDFTPYRTVVNAVLGAYGATLESASED